MQLEADDFAHPVVNVEETIGKTVGRRKQPDAGKVQRIGREIYENRGFTVAKKGVYRFHSHEEANEWMNQFMIQRALKANQKPGAGLPETTT